MSNATDVCRVHQVPWASHRIPSLLMQEGTPPQRTLGRDEEGLQQVALVVLPQTRIGSGSNSSSLLSNSLD